MRIYLWTALRIRDLRMRDLVKNLWFLKEGFGGGDWLIGEWD